MSAPFRDPLTTFIRLLDNGWFEVGRVAIHKDRHKDTFVPVASCADYDTAWTLVAQGEAKK